MARFRTGIFILLVLFLTHINADETSAASCERVKQEYLNLGYSSLDVPVNSITLQADNLEICPAGLSCCTRDMEQQLTEHSRSELAGRLALALSHTNDLLNRTTLEFHVFFTEQISNTKRELDNMFTKAYNESYTQNRHLFFNLFDRMLEYYGGANVDISTEVDKFFQDVFVRMFVMQNPDKQFNEQYLECVSSKMDAVKPFDDTPAQLRRNIRQALLASRTFIQGLAVARNVGITAQKHQLTASCNKAYMRMSYCSHCRGLPTLRPCQKYCLNVMNGCLAYKNQLAQPWRSFVGALDNLAMRLESEGSYNIESVLSPLKDQISTAIMSYHSKSAQINTKMFDEQTGCGVPPPATMQPSSTKSKRSTISYNPNLPLRHRGKARLRALIRAVRQGLTTTRDLWGLGLSSSVCSKMAATNSDDICWNGEDGARYQKTVVGPELAENSRNPEVTVDTSRADEVITKQKQQLIDMRSRLVAATDGTDVTWLDLQVPLPIVNPLITAHSNADDAAKSVKSSLLGRGRITELYQGSGSDELSGQYFLDPDDEDSGSGNGRWSIVLPWNSERSTNKNDEVYSGSGTIIDTDDEDSVTVSLPSAEPPAQANNQPEEDVTLKEPYEVDAPEETPTGKASHSVIANTWLVVLTVVVWAAGTGLPGS